MAEIKEGDFVMGNTKDGVVHGRVEHIMREGGTLGTPGDEYALESMPPDNPAMSVRVYEEEDGKWEPTPYSIGMMYQDAERLDTLDGHSMESEDDEEDDKEEYMSKADTYKPTSSMAAAARRAIKWREEGKATGAGTPVGWRRASQLVNRQPLTLDTVKRMYSFFSRHEVDKKGKGFYSGPEFPSNGRIMWDAWGGDAGFRWSRAIVNRAKKQEASKAGNPGVGSMVTWNSSGGRAEGKITRIVRDGKINVPNSDFTITGTPEDPAALIRLYRDGKPTDTYVGHKLSTLKPLAKSYSPDTEDEYPEDDYAHLPEEELAVDDFEKRDYTEAQRKRMALRGQAMDDGSFPIADETDLRNAIQSVGRAKDYEAAKRHIMRRAKQLRLENLLPDEWKSGVKKTWGGFFGG